MGLIYALAHFQYMVEIILNGNPGSCFLPVVIYLDYIAMYGDTQKQGLDDMLEDIKYLIVAYFILNLQKKQVVQSTA